MTVADASPSPDTEPDAARSRTYDWADPMATARAAVGLTGLEFLERLASGEIAPPPLASTLDFALTEVSEGEATFTFEPHEFHYNPIGMVHGGVAATLLDSALGCAVQSALPVGSGYSTLELKINSVRAIRADTGPMRGTATLIHLGRQVGTAEARLVDQDGKLYAHATTTCLVFPLDS
jgi:uncharacterized protein (TIGR00369 family)